MVFGTNVDFSQFLSARDFFEFSAPETIQENMPKFQATEKLVEPKAGVSDYLVAFATQSQSHCVGCVDMVNSTKMSAIIPAKKLSGYYEIFLNSMSKIVGKFNGQVIKNVGDCLLYYFPDPDKNIGFRNSLNCGLAMIKSQGIICNQLERMGLPCLSYRVSSDYGNVMIMNTSDSSSIDMIGPPVNMCTKINHCAKSNEFVIGGDFYEMVKKFEEYNFKPVTGCNVGFKLSYPVYKVIA